MLPIGIWTAQFDYQPAAKVQEAAAELDELGYGAIWFPESVGREAMTQAALLLAGTSRIMIATGIARNLSQARRVASMSRPASAGFFATCRGV